METLKLYITKSGKVSIYVTIDANGIHFFSYPKSLNDTLKEKGVTRYSVSWLSNELKARLVKL